MEEKSKWYKRVWGYLSTLFIKVGKEEVVEHLKSRGIEVKYKKDNFNNVKRGN